MQKQFLLMDGTMTMHGVRFLPNGGRWERFKNNPTMLYMHERGRVIGKWTDLEFKSDAWYATPVFDQKDPFAAQIARKVNDGFLNACSLGVLVHAASEINGEPVVTDWEPYENSIVDAGSNYNALQLYAKDGKPVSNIDSFFKDLKLSIGMDNPGIQNRIAKALPPFTLYRLGVSENDDNNKVISAINVLLNKQEELVAFAKKHEHSEEQDKEEYRKLFLEGGLIELKASNPARFDRLHTAYYGAAPDKQSTLKAASLPKLEEQTFAATKSDREEWAELHKSGRLIDLKMKNPEKFRRLYHSEFGVEP